MHCQAYLQSTVILIFCCFGFWGGLGVFLLVLFVRFCWDFFVGVVWVSGGVLVGLLCLFVLEWVFF